MKFQTKVLDRRSSVFCNNICNVFRSASDRAACRRSCAQCCRKRKKRRIPNGNNGNNGSRNDCGCGCN